MRMAAPDQIVICKNCGNRMDRISRNSGDHGIDKLTFGIYKMKRYLCYACRDEKCIMSRNRISGLKNFHSA